MVGITQQSVLVVGLIELRELGMNEVLALGLIVISETIKF